MRLPSGYFTSMQCVRLQDLPMELHMVATLTRWSISECGEARGPRWVQQKRGRGMGGGQDGLSTRYIDLPASDASFLRPGGRSRRKPSS